MAPIHTVMNMYLEPGGLNAINRLYIFIQPTVHTAKVYYIEGYRNYDFRFLQTMFKIKIS